MKHFILIALLIGAGSGGVMASATDDGINRANTVKPMSTTDQTAIREANIKAVSARADCDEDIARSIDQSNKALQAEMEILMTTVIDKPTKTADIDCLSQLTSLSFGFNIPSMASLADNILDQAKQAACNIAVRETNSLTDSLGLDLNGNLGTSIGIPGTGQQINVNAGSYNAGINSNAGTAPVGTKATLESQIKKDSDGNIRSGSGTATAGGDLDSFLGNVFN